ncbi:serine/threonine protein kinase [Clostridiales bacterium COT073_COT-073]|nr:serine/threonine protein kinase [Clostridiales bacterium COT073_COT-073]
MYQEYLIIGISFVGIAIILGLIGIFSGRKKTKPLETEKLPSRPTPSLQETQTIYMEPTVPVAETVAIDPDQTQTIVQTQAQSELGGSKTASGRKAYQALQAGAVVNERYRVERVLGEGAQGSVYVCTNIELGNMWAMKHFQGGLNEKDILVKLNHISLPKIADVFTDGDDRYIVESFVEGFPLHKFAEARKSELNEDLAISFMIQLSEALQYIHKQSIIHMDIKPQNIIITEDYKAILIDFGIASLKDGEKAKTYEIRGYTPSFASPEQKAFSSDIDERTDIYSLGATIAYIFKENTISKEFAAILNRCMAENKAARFSDVKILRDALLQLQKQKIDALHRRKRNRLLRRLAIPLVLVGVSSLGYYGYLQYREQNSELILPQTEFILSEQKEMPISIRQRYADGEERILPDKWIKWQSENSEIAVLENGIILAKNAGSTVLVGSYYNKTLEIPITVESGVLGVDISLKYSKTAKTEIYAGTGERDSQDGKLKAAAFFEPRSIAEWEDACYVVDGDLREIKNDQVSTIDLEFLKPEVIKADKNGLYLSVRPWQEGEAMLLGIFRLNPAKEELEEVFTLPIALKEISDFILTDKGIYFLLTDYVEEKTDLCFYDNQADEITVLLEQEDEIKGITQTQDGQIYLAQAKNSVIYRFAQGNLEYFAGAKYEKDFVDGPLPKLYMPMALTTNGNDLYVWDYHMLRKIILEDGKITDTVSLSGQADQEDDEVILTGSAYEVSYQHSTKTGISYVDGKVYICQPNSSYIRVVEE